MSITMGQLATRYSQAADKVDPLAQKELKRFSAVGSGLVKRQIQELHAVDTGTMLNSTSVEKSGNDAYLIGPTVQYATYVALGTSRMPARPFHTNAANQLQKKIRDFKLKEIGI